MSKLKQYGDPLLDSPSSDPLSRELIGQLWMCIVERLQDGQVLITQEQFQQAMEEEYLSLTGIAVREPVRRRLRRMIVGVNTRHPETYVAKGVQNGVTTAFDRGVMKLKWNEAKIQAKGARSIKRFNHREMVRDLLDEVNVRPDQIDALQCVRHAIQEIQGAGGAPVISPRTDRSVKRLPPAAPPAAADRFMADPEVQTAILQGDVDKEEVSKRQRAADERGGHLNAREKEKVPERLHVYVAKGTITEEEAEQLKQLHQVDMRLKQGEIDEGEANRLRNSVLHGWVRDELEKKIQEEVDQSVRYMQVYEAMQKIGRQADEALEFLVRHKEIVVAEKPEAEGITRVIREMGDDEPLLNKVMEIVDRKDHEIRMMSVRLPPYNFIMNRGMEKIANMTVGVDFIRELRKLELDTLSERLNSPNKEVRVRPAADMRCLISLIDHATKRTPFRKEVRLLRLSQSIEEFYNSTSDIQEARHQAQNFLKRRLRKLFPDMQAEEAAEIRRRSAEIIDSIEERILEERRAQIEEQRRKAEEARTQAQTSGGDEGDELELTEEERNMGVQIGRVEVRVAGSYRRVPQKIMPDPDESERFVVVHRDSETGELQPQIRRRRRRYVVRDRDGVWRPE